MASPRFGHCQHGFRQARALDLDARSAFLDLAHFFGGRSVSGADWFGVRSPIAGIVYPTQFAHHAPARTRQAGVVMAGSPLAKVHDFRLGPIHVRPAARTIESRKGSFVTEPLVMQLLVELSRKVGRVVSRGEIFERCWGSAPVGDDSLNRIVAALRRTLSQADGETVLLETVAGSGYALRFTANGNGGNPGDVGQAVQEGLDSVRRGLPEPDHLRLEMLRRAVLLDAESASAWGMLALLCRYAAEYAEPSEVADFVTECQTSARAALRIEPQQPYALVAVATLAPIFGRWLEARQALEHVLEATPGEFIAEHELVICDMSAGQVQAAVTRTNRLIAADPLAACMIYKGIYQRWSSVDLFGMDQLGERGMHLWPTHAAVWTARFWTLAFTDRLDAAAAMLDDTAPRPEIPQPMLRLLKTVIAAACGGSAEIERAAAVALQAAASGPVRAITALFALGLLHRVDDGFTVAEAYYLRHGSGPVPLHSTKGELTTNDLHRRVTQILFTPACAEMRRDSRFLNLCERIGLSAYWEQTGLTPDFLC